MPDRKPAKKTIPFHEVANIFPLMEGEGFQVLVNDIRKNGLREAIWLLVDKSGDTWIIDGRNRYNAVLRLQEQGHPIQHRFREWDGKGNLTAFVVSLNLHRRHLTEGQREMIAAKLSNQKRGGDRKSQNIKPPNGGMISQAEAAELMKVSERNVQRASKVLKHGDETLVSAVQSGTLPVSVAAQSVDAVEKYPEVKAIRGARPQDRIAIASNLDRLPEDERKKKLKLLAKGHSDTLTSLANKPPMPKKKPESSFDRWDNHIDGIVRTLIEMQRVMPQLMSEWDDDEKQRFLNRLESLQSRLTSLETTTLGSMDYDETRTGAEAQTTVH